MDNIDAIEVIVENVVFQNAEGTFCVFRVRHKELGAFTVVYAGAAPYLGENLVVSGHWVEHARFGRQLQATSCRTQTPSTTEGVLRFLASGAISGVGKTMAERIVKAFGARSLEIIEQQPERLLEVEGIGSKRLRDIVASYTDLKGMRELMVFLEEHGISSTYAPRVAGAYGSSAITRISNNPYGLVTDIVGIGFKLADRIAMSLGIEPSSEERIKAGIAYVLLQAGNGGHTCVPEELLIEKSMSFLQLDSVEILQAFQKLLQEDQLRLEDVGGVRYIYPEYLYQAERGVAKRLLYLRDKVNQLWKVDYKHVVQSWEEQEGLQLAPEQVEAIKASVEHGIFVLTGGPGTGKTTVIKGILSVLQEAGCKLLLAAPTGRAARRLAESTQAKAQTVHKLLEYTPNGAGGFFGRNSDTPIEADAIIVDEASMLDIVLMHNLLKAVPVGCRLILAGDVDQLPSVGPGSVLKDIIRSQSMPVVRLENVFRQGELSPIVLNAHRINRGEEPVFQPSGDFTFTALEDEDEVAAYVVDRYTELTEGEAWERVQVLAPMHRYSCGVQNINKLLQQRVNPPSPLKGALKQGEHILRAQDKVMQITNNYEKNVFNGDIGRIKEIRGNRVIVDFPERAEGSLVIYEGKDVAELQLAYAISVHKSQGSEYDTVIIPLVKSHYMLLQRNLLYTGITRAKQRVLLAGSKQALAMAVHNDKTRKRFSLLAERLQAEQNFN